MKKYLIIIPFLISLILSITSCAIEGEKIVGIWYTNGDLGKMKIEIKSKRGTFVGHLLEQEENNTMVEMRDKPIIFEGLIFEEDKYLHGSFLKGAKSNNPCGFKLAFTNEVSMNAAYQCDGVNRLEYYHKNRYPEKPVIETRVTKISLDQLIKPKK